ncbi:MAG TPA: ATP-binding protein [Stellaceae bacterium]|nr:ATP-binding protein [Stellaceae bacterium]
MAARELTAGEVGLPKFSIGDTGTADVFSLESHRRAREALDFGLSVSDIGFNVFVIGDDRASRMTATLAYLNELTQHRAPARDWIFLNNFRDAASPTPRALPAGMGRQFRDRMADFVPRLREAFGAAFSGEAYQARFMALREGAEAAVGEEMAALRATARRHGMELVESPEGPRLARPQDAPAAAPLDEAAERELSAAFMRLQRMAIEARARLNQGIEALNRAIAETVIVPLLGELQHEFGAEGGLAQWLDELRGDVIDNPGRFRTTSGEREGEAVEAPERRYAVNLFVDHYNDVHPLVVLESNPTYENLFGRIEYRQAQGTIATDVTLIRPGALHQANGGGMLVLRAEALAANPASWSFLKAALRDGLIRIEELQRAQGQAIAGAPQPRPIPLDLKVVIVGAPRWYSLFFEGDPDFHVYFKIKADIDSDMAASPENIAVYAGLISAMTRARGLKDASAEAVGRLLGISARWAGHRQRLTARVELIEDLVAEAAPRDTAAKAVMLTESSVHDTYTARRRRNSRIEDRILRGILDNEVMIETAGRAIGQVNGLTVYDMGDRRFGTPVRITARASVGRAGLVNIERDVALGGPIQQKAAMVLQGFLAGSFAQVRPLSFTCSITFEQTYGGVEGDSASLAELIAVLSDLAQLPVRQDIAITGSMNQAGMAQTIGGAYTKIEGFYRLCSARPGGLTGGQGVILPEANRMHIILHDDLAEAVAAGRFHLWTVATLAEAAELMMGTLAGSADADGNYPPDTIFGRAAARLATFDRILAARREPPG